MELTSKRIIDILMEQYIKDNYIRCKTCEILKPSSSDLTWELHDVWKEETMHRIQQLNEFKNRLIILSTNKNNKHDLKGAL